MMRWSHSRLDSKRGYFNENLTVINLIKSFKVPWLLRIHDNEYNSGKYEIMVHDNSRRLVNVKAI